MQGYDFHQRHRIVMRLRCVHRPLTKRSWWRNVTSRNGMIEHQKGRDATGTKPQARNRVTGTKIATKEIQNRMLTHAEDKLES